MKKTIVIIIVVIVILGLGGVAYYVVQNQTGKVTNKNNQNQAKQQLNVTKSEKNTNELPDKFPTDIPIETGAKIIQNYNASTPDGRFQATRVFESAKSMDENLKIYKDYLTSKNYKLQPVVEVPNFKSISGTNDNMNLQVSMNYNASTKITTVSINLTQLPKSK